MMTLGRNDAAISPSFIEDLTLEGPLGHTGKVFLSPFISLLITSREGNSIFFFFAARKLAYLWRLPTDEHRAKVGISWLTKSAVDSVAALQSTLTKVLSGS